MSNPATLTELFLDAVKRYGTKRAALRYIENGTWHDISHQEVARKVKLISIGLRELGLPSGAHVAILSSNRPEWAITDFACLMASCTNVAVYPTLPAEQIEYILHHSESWAVFVEDREQYDKVAQVRERLPGLECVILFEGEGDSPDDLSLHSLMRKGEAAEAGYPNYEADGLRARPEDIATLIYTSGTTGNPKGVMLRHGNICSNVAAVLKMIAIGPDDSTLSFLPLCHSFERMAGHYTMFHRGVTVNYAESIDTIARDLIDVAPTVVLAVPRVYEKIFARVLDNALSGGALKRRIFFWARRTAEEWADLSLAGQPIPSGLAFKKKVADRLVFSKLVARTGGRIRYFISGAAPLSPEIAKFFYAAGLPIAEGYGLTETSPVISFNPPDAIGLGTVGLPISDVEVRIADDGEILVKGPNVMAGYFRNEEATAEVIDPDGWFHTGDVGEITDRGYLKITDRKKDIIVTAGGKNIAPQPIENQVKLNKFILNAVMLGDKQRFPVILVVPNPETLHAWAAERNMSGLSDAELIAHPDTVAKIEREVMLQLRGLASYETPKKVLLVERDFTIESGELTPTMKVKRKVVLANYESLIAAAYAE